ncbi:MAG: LuxR family transcriptional regulator [Haliea sp.]
MSKVQEFREQMRSAGSMDDIQCTLESTFGDMGFEQLSYVVLRPPHGVSRPKVLTTFPEEWTGRYVDFNYSDVDAVYPAASAYMFPLRWDELYSDGRTTRKQRLVFDEASEFGNKNGLTVPIHGPAGGLASLSMSGDLTQRDIDQIWDNFYDELTLFAAYAHEAILKHTCEGESLEPIRLTDRERECLVWTARGKTAWEIGQISKISENTVLFHLNNCMKKLRVFSKHHAVVKAIMLGIIVPEI